MNEKEGLKLQSKKLVGKYYMGHLSECIANIKFSSKIKEKFFFNKNSPFKYIYFLINNLISRFSFKKSFSQGSMDLILEHIFKTKNDGFYVDVGCQHPIKNNNTYLLYKKGWSGVNIDLDSVNIDLFNFFRQKL